MNHDHGDPASRLRALLRADLTTAMKARRPDHVAAIRTTMAALDNAEAVAGVEHRPTSGGEHVAASRVGVGSTEAERRVLSAAEVRALLRDQITERTSEAKRYDAHGRHDAAERLRRQAEALGRYDTD